MDASEFIYLIVDALRDGADAADRIDACKKCGAVPGQGCITSTKGDPWPNGHGSRLPGDPVLSFTLRAIADTLEYRVEKLELNT